MIIVGQQEQEEGKVSVRSREKGDEGQQKIEDFTARIKEEIYTKRL